MTGDAIAALMVLLVVVAFVALCVVGAVKAARAVQRRVEQHGTQARRAVEDAAIRARAYTRPGAHGQAATVRSELRAALAAARRVLESGVGGDPQLGEALGLLTRLEGHAKGLDADLRELERRPVAEVEAQLPVLRERAERIVHSATSLRWAAQDRRGRWADDDLERLSAEAEAEAGALRHWVPAEERVDGRPGGQPGGRSGDRGALGAGGARVSAEEELGLGRYPRRRRAQG